MEDGPRFSREDLWWYARRHRLRRKFPLTKAQARELCAAAVEVYEPRVITELPKAKRFRQYWRAYCDHTKV
jgi:hypothetical protein